MMKDANDKLNKYWEGMMKNREDEKEEPEAAKDTESNYSPSIDYIYIHTYIYIHDWTEGKQEVCRLEDELDKDVVYHQFCSTCMANVLQRKLCMGLETLTSEGKLIIQTVKYADELLLMAKEETVLQGMHD
jgi:hypothetical protein